MNDSCYWLIRNFLTILVIMLLSLFSLLPMQSLAAGDGRPAFGRESRAVDRRAEEFRGDERADRRSVAADVGRDVDLTARRNTQAAMDIKALSKAIDSRVDRGKDAKSLMDQMVFDAAKKGAGGEIMKNTKLGDSRFSGMEKWEYREKSNAGLDSVVHYVRDPATGNLMDFKFKKNAVNK